MLEHRFCVAPMMDWTDRHDRAFLRQFSRRALLYTEMVTSAALEHGDAGYLLQHDLDEHPVALQLGGSNPQELARAAAQGEIAGFDEINLNVGCPSDRVQSGAFGACLMADPPLVARCVSSMQAAVDIPVTVKCRTGIDDQDSEAALLRFIDNVAKSGCKIFIIHARKAYLQGLSPKENREIPPLNYERVFSVKQNFPELEIVINGGISSMATVAELLTQVDGVMLGREAYQNPYIMHGVDTLLFSDSWPEKSRLDYLQQYLPYIESELAKGTPLQHMTRHLLGLFKGQQGGRLYRRHLSEHSHKKNVGIEVLLDAITYVN
ncbi:MAG: tRNA dihydrouridine(20/20a) synthase DusA [Proteobacteria bacterium]|nr:tRNA dihydrouridine(20/20a) synthase DusA [Pseudomonadota bacterium]